MTAAPLMKNAEPGLVVLIRAPWRSSVERPDRLPLSAETRKMMGSGRLECLRNVGYCANGRHADHHSLYAAGPFPGQTETALRYLSWE